MSQHPKKRFGYLCSEIARLKQTISENESKHATLLSSWTKECGHKGNEIGRLKQTILQTENELKDSVQSNSKLSQENSVLESVVKKLNLQIECLYSEIARLKQTISENESKHATSLSSWTKECGHKGNEIVRLEQIILQTENKLKDSVQSNSKLSQENSVLESVNKQMNLQISELKALIDMYEKSVNFGTSKSDEKHSVQIIKIEKQELEIPPEQGSTQCLDLPTIQETRENEITVKEKPKSFWNYMTTLKKQMTKGNKQLKSSRSLNDQARQKEMSEECDNFDSFRESINLIKAEVSELKIKLSEKDEEIDFYKGVCDAKVSEIEQLRKCM